MDLQQVVDGLSVGGSYALAALGLAAVYRLLGFMQISHGQMITLGAYVGYLLTKWTGEVLVSLLLTMVLMALLGFVVQRALFERVLGGSHLVPLLVAFGIGLAVTETLRILVMNGNPVHYDEAVIENDQAWRLFDDVYVVPSQLLMATIAVLLIVGTHVFLQKTQIGRRMRAVAANRDSAEVLGINSRFVFGVVMAFAFATAGLLGVLIGSDSAYVSPTFADNLGFIALAVVLFAGLGSLIGLLLASAAIGLAESFTTAAGYSSYASMLPFVVIMLVLLLRPNGLFGTLAQERN